MKYLGILALAAVLLPVAVSAQDSAMTPNPITSLIKRQVVQYGQWQVAGAQAMPAEEYTYQSTKETRTFAQLILHVAQFNNNMCARISGMTAPDIKDVKETDSKDKLVAAVKGPSISARLQLTVSTIRHWERLREKWGPIICHAAAPS